VSPFQFYFSFFTLIIGLAVAGVARNFGALWQHRVGARVGYLTPLLAVFLLLDISHFWLGLWEKQQIATLGPLALASVLCVALPYVFVTTIMFPASPAEWESLDEYYFLHSRAIFISLTFSKAAAYLFDFLLFGWRPTPAHIPGIALVVLPFIALIVFCSARVHYAGLIFLILWSGFILAMIG
jgi:hypothetical protein